MSDRIDKIRPIDLQRTAAAIAKNYGDKGAAIVTFGEDGIRVGVSNLTPDELREPLCTAVHYSFVFEEDD